MLMEVQRLHRPERESESAEARVKKLHRLPEKSLQQAKAHFGEAVKVAIGHQPRRLFGSETLISGVVSGEKVPDYIGRICQDDDTRRRLGRELIRGARGVRRREVFEFEDEVG